MIICFACMQFSLVCQQPLATAEVVSCMSRSPACNLSQRWDDRHCQSANVAWPAAAAHAVTCSDYNFNDVPAGATGSVVIIKDSWNSFIIYYIYIYVLLYIIIYCITNEVKYIFLLFQT